MRSFCDTLQWHRQPRRVQKRNYLANMIAKQLTWHLIEILNTPQEYITKIRMNEVTYLNAILRIFKNLDVDHYGVEGESGTAFFASQQSWLAHVLFCISITPGTIDIVFWRQRRGNSIIMNNNDYNLHNASRLSLQTSHNSAENTKGADF